jgi:hypothetical protein
MATIKGDPKDYVIRQPGLDYFLTIKIGQGASTHTTYFNPGGLVIDDENINGKLIGKGGAITGKSIVPSTSVISVNPNIPEIRVRYFITVGSQEIEDRDAVAELIWKDGDPPDPIFEQKIRFTTDV